MKRRIAVGVKSISRDATGLSWAARDARPGLDEIHVVHAYRSLALTGCVWPPVVRANDARRTEARRTVAAALTALHAASAGVAVDGSAIAGNPAEVLTALSEVVDLLVVGCAAPGDVADPPGPDHQRALRTAQHAACPVVVVPSVERTDAAGDADRPVAVLVGGGALPLRSIDFALDSAQRLGAALVVAQSCPVPAAGPAAGARALLGWETSRQEELDAQLAASRAEYSDVGVIVELRRESVSATVDLMRRTARLLVLARPFDEISGGAFDRILSAPTGCPVAVVAEVCGDGSLPGSAGSAMREVPVPAAVSAN